MFFNQYFLQDILQLSYKKNTPYLWLGYTILQYLTRNVVNKFLQK